MYKHDYCRTPSRNDQTDHVGGRPHVHPYMGWFPSLNRQLNGLLFLCLYIHNTLYIYNYIYIFPQARSIVWGSSWGLFPLRRSAWRWSFPSILATPHFSEDTYFLGVGPASAIWVGTYIIRPFLFKEALHVCNPVGLYSSLGNEMPPHINIINIASVLDLWGI